MKLLQYASVAYVPGTASERRQLTVKEYSVATEPRVLWQGNAVDLMKWHNALGWEVVEILVDHSTYDPLNPKPDYNLGKIITVI